MMEKKQAKQSSVITPHSEQKIDIFNADTMTRNEAKLANQTNPLQ